MEIKTDNPLFVKREDCYITGIITTLAFGSISNNKYIGIFPNKTWMVLTDITPSNIQEERE